MYYSKEIMQGRYIMYFIIIIIFIPFFRLFKINFEHVFVLHVNGT